MDKSLISIICVFTLMGVFFFFYEKSRISVKEIPLLVVLAGLAALGRLPFAAIPGLQPTTFMVIISGFVFGPLSGFVVGAMAALVSNIFLGQGPWTIWQMFAWALCGVSSGLLGRIWPKLDLKFLLFFSFLWGYFFGWIMNFWHWISFIYPLNLRTWIATNITSFGFDSLHAIGNLLFMLIFGRSFINILRYFQKKLVITYE